MEYTIGIIDVHAHILPEVDDGAEDMDETNLMLQCAYAQGIRGIIATPHYVERHNLADADAIRESVKLVQIAAKNIAPDFYIYPGQEIFYFDGIAEALRSGKALTLADTRYVLIEFSVSISYQDIVKAVRRLTQARYIPVLAHIERYRCLRNVGRVEELIQAGAYMQMNYASLTGMRHVGDRRWCRKMILAGRIHLLGTDMHRMDYRPPNVREAVEWLYKKVEPPYPEQLMRLYPEILLSGELL